MISSICSKPTEIRTIPSVIPVPILSSEDNLLCVVEAGWVTILLESPKLAESDNILMASKNRCPATTPPFISNATTQPPALICRLAMAYWGCDLKKGYFTQFTLGWTSKNSANFNALSQCLSTRTAKVSKLLESIHALKGDKEGPVILENRYILSISFSLPTVIPARTLPCPSINFVPEWITRSAPNLMGCCK